MWETEANTMEARIPMIVITVRSSMREKALRCRLPESHEVSRADEECLLWGYRFIGVGVAEGKGQEDQRILPPRSADQKEERGQEEEEPAHFRLGDGAY